MLATCPLKIELGNGNAMFEPVIAHVERFRAFHADLCFENSMGSGIVGFERSARRGLFVSHLVQCGEDRDCILGVEEMSTGFSFGSRGRDTRKSLAENVNSTIGLGIGRIFCGSVGQSEKASSATACFREDKIGGIRHNR